MARALLIVLDSVGCGGAADAADATMNVLCITKLQRAGGKRLAAADFLRGVPVAAGMLLLSSPHPV